MMYKYLAEAFAKALLIPTGVTQRAEKHGSLVVVHAMHLPAVAGEMNDDFGADEAR